MPFVALQPLVKLLAVHANALGRINANPHLIAFDADDGNPDARPNYQSLTQPPCQYQHMRRPGPGSVLNRGASVFYAKNLLVSCQLQNGNALCLLRAVVVG